MQRDKEWKKKIEDRDEKWMNKLKNKNVIY